MDGGLTGWKLLTPVSDHVFFCTTLRQANAEPRFDSTQWARTHNRGPRSACLQQEGQWLAGSATGGLAPRWCEVRCVCEDRGDEVEWFQRSTSEAKARSD